MITPPSVKSSPMPPGGITLGDIKGPPLPQSPNMPISQPSVPQETIVVPPSTDMPKEPEKSAPFFSEPPSSQVPLPGDAPVSVPPSNPWPRRLMVLSILLVIILGALFGGRFIYQSMQTTKEVTITYWGLWETEAIIRPVITAFEANNPKIKVQYERQSPKQYRERLQAAIARDEGPDIYRFHNTWVPMLHDDLAPVPAEIMTTSEFTETFYPVASNDLVAGDTIFGIPLEIDGLGLYYNEEIFARAGITSPPTTWEELLAMVPKIAKPNGESFAISAIALGTTNNVEHYSDILATMFMQNGATITSPTGKEGEETLLFYRKFASPSDPLYTWNETMDNSVYAFASGKVAMILAPSWRAFDIYEINPSLRFKIVPIPQLPGNTVNWASYWVEGVSSKSLLQPQAWEFVKYLTSKEGASLIYSEATKARKLFGEPYARKDLASMITDDPYAGAYIKQAVNARSFPLASRTFDNGLNDKLITYLTNAMNALKIGSAPAEELQTMSAGFKQVFTTYGLTTNAAPDSTTSP